MRVGIFVVLCTVLVFIFSCTKEVSSQPKFVFKESSKAGIVAQTKEIEITEKELIKDIKADIFEKEMEIFELKMARLKSLLIEKLVKADPKAKGMSNDQYFAKYIEAGSEPTKKEIEAFIKKMNVPAKFLTDQYRARVKEHLMMQKRKDALENWLAQKTKGGINVFFPKPERPYYDVKVGNSPWFGSKDAKVTIVEFSDFQCPHCKNAALSIVKGLKKKYGKKIKFVFKQFPLPFHTQAKVASEASLCAQEQGNDYFWKMHDALFEDQTKFAVPDLKATAKRIGLDAKKFDNCLDGHRYLAAVDAEKKEGEALGVKATPTFFVNGKLVAGARDISTFSEIIDQEL